MEAADRWFGSAGGGEGALLAACLLAAMDAVDGASDAMTRLGGVLDDARDAGDAETTVLALDAMARSRAQAAQMDDARRISTPLTTSCPPPRTD